MMKGSSGPQFLNQQLVGLDIQKQLIFPYHIYIQLLHRHQIDLTFLPLIYENTMMAGEWNGLYLYIKS